MNGEAGSHGLGLVVYGFGTRVARASGSFQLVGDTGEAGGVIGSTAFVHVEHG